MKRLNLILNGKGGVGKSFFAVNFVQYLKDKGIAHVAIDSDNENSTLNRFHPDARFVDLADRRGPDGIFNTLEKSNLVIMDYGRTNRKNTALCAVSTGNAMTFVCAELVMLTQFVPRLFVCDCNSQPV